jgi:hypothetical protein
MKNLSSNSNKNILKCFTAMYYRSDDAAGLPQWSVLKSHVCKQIKCHAVPSITKLKMFGNIKCIT